MSNQIIKEKLMSKPELIKQLSDALNNPNLHIDEVNLKMGEPRLGITRTREFDFLIQIQGLVIEEPTSYSAKN